MQSATQYTIVQRFYNQVLDNAKSNTIEQRINNQGMNNVKHYTVIVQRLYN